MRAYTNSGRQLSMWTTIRRNGIIVRQGFTPLTYSGNSGTYSVTVANFSNLVFDRWANGLRNNTRTETLTQAAVATWVAYYNEGSSGTTTSLTIQARQPSGSLLTGYWTVVTDSNTGNRSTGFTTFSTQVTTGRTYTVTVADYGQWVFDRWDNGSSNRARSITPSGNTTITAHFRSTSGINNILPRTGAYFALYTYPGATGSSQWERIRNSKLAHPRVPFIVTFNPASGVGTARNSNIAYWVNRLKSAGIYMIGYIPDGYGDTRNPGSRTMSYMRQSIDRYRDWYNADGIFLDEFSNNTAFRQRYVDINNHAKGMGMSITMSNPGTDIPTSFIGVCDIHNTSEGAGYIDSNNPNIIGASWVSGGYTGWHRDHNKRNFAIMRYACSWLNRNFVNSIYNDVGLILITSGTDADGRWFTIPSYWEEFVAMLDR